MIVAAVYARKSTDEPGKDAEDASCPKQIANAREFAKQKGWRVDESLIFRDDGVSGSEFAKRHGLQKLLAVLKPKPKFQVLIVRNQSRLGRDYRRVVALGVELEDAGIETWSYQAGKRILHQDDVQEMQEFVEGKSDERRLIDDARNTREGQQTVAAKRHVGGKLYGYKHVPTGELNKRGFAVTKRVVAPKEAKVVLLIFQMRARGCGFHVIADHLNDKKVPSSRASTPDGEKAQNTGLWSAQAVGGITKNAHYAGRIVWGQTRSKKITAEVKKGFAAKLVERIDEDLRIVPEQLWRDVQRVNAEAGKLAWRRPGGQFLSRPTGKHWASRHLRCGLCDGPMRIKVYRPRKPGQPVQPPMLFCSRRANGEHRCANDKMLSVAKAEREIIAKFEEALKPAAVAATFEGWTKDRREAKQLGKEERAKLEREARELELYIDGLIRASAKIDAPEKYKAEIEGSQTMLKAIRDKLEGAEVLATIDPRLMADAVEAVALDWKKQLRRDPGVIGQVLGKLLHEKIKLTPPKEKRGEWGFEAERVDLLALVREADEDVAEAMEGLMRELDLDPKDVEAAKAVKPKAAKVARTRAPS
jgi:DNA invertase Pin-like site-specific DNA recombinase